MWLMLYLLVSAPTETPDLAQVIEFQYKQKLEAAESENMRLRETIQKLQKTKSCSYASEASDKSSETSLAEKKNTVSESPDDQKAYQTAFKEIQNENWNEAVVLMEAFVQQFPQSNLADNALFWIAQVYFQKNEKELARSELQRLLKFYPHGDRAKRAEAILLNLSPMENKTVKTE